MFWVLLIVTKLAFSYYIEVLFTCGNSSCFYVPILSKLI